MKKLIPALVAIVLIFVIVAAGIGMKLVEKYSYSEERADMEAYYELEGDEEVAIIMQDELLEERALLLDGTYYFSFDFVHENLNQRFYANEEEGVLLYTTPDDIIKTYIGESLYIQNGEEDDAGYAIARYEGDELYIAAEYVKMFTNFFYETFAEPNRMQIYTQWDEFKAAEVKKNTQIRYQGGIKSEILLDVEKGTDIVVLEEMETWVKVKHEGVIGYLEKKRLSDVRTEKREPVTDYEEPVYSNQVRDHKISMAWHQVTNTVANETLTEMTASAKGLNVISPTWFSLSDNEGNFTNISSSAYVEKAHQMGMEVWGLIDNFSTEIDTHQILSSSQKRAYLIQGLIDAAGACGMDGINIDFEQVKEETGPHFVQFIRELSIACRANELVLSIDNYVPVGNTDHYGRAAQGEVADYVIIMGYDEHWSGSEEAGSVASIDFVELGIEKTLEEVPAEKIINGVPFYTRVWQSKGGDLYSEAVGMYSAEAFLKNHGVEAQWDETTCQNYAAFEKGDALYQVWLEDEQSMEVKLNIMEKHGIAGVAAWKLGLEKKSIWDVIDAYLQK